mmetsp:Transcript_9380/g.10374  ORF Transcript_9380/g.10374 Transcript_9380/m.10374 type:complete len:198 (+) Transcript_9380:66-659(+)
MTTLGTDCILDGFMMKKKRGKNWKRRYLQLMHNGKLAYSKSDEAGEEPLGVLTIANNCYLSMEYRDYSHSGVGQNRLIIGLSEDTFYFGSLDKKEVETWFLAIRHVLVKNVSKNGRAQLLRTRPRSGSFRTPPPLENKRATRVSITNGKSPPRPDKRLIRVSVSNGKPPIENKRVMRTSLGSCDKPNTTMYIENKSI